MAGARRSEAAREPLDVEIDRWVDAALSKLPPLTDEARRHAVAILATAKPRRTNAA